MANVALHGEWAVPSLTERRYLAPRFNCSEFSASTESACGRWLPWAGCHPRNTTQLLTLARGCGEFLARHSRSFNVWPRLTWRRLLIHRMDHARLVSSPLELPRDAGWAWTPAQWLARNVLFKVTLCPSGELGRATSTSCWERTPGGNLGLLVHPLRCHAVVS